MKMTSKQIPVFKDKVVLVMDRDLVIWTGNCFAFAIAMAQQNTEMAVQAMNLLREQLDNDDMATKIELMVTALAKNYQDIYVKTCTHCDCLPGDTCCFCHTVIPENG